MNCKQIQDQLIDFIDDNLDQKTYQIVKMHLKSCDDCNNEFQELQGIFKGIQNEPQELPDASMKMNFERMLQEEKDLLKEPKVVSLPKESRNYWRTAFQIAATITLVISAYFYGKLESNESLSQEMAVLEKEKIEMKQSMTISLIENESASKRLQAVNYAEEFEKPGNEILKALINKMNYDDHINVRLAAAEALAKFSDSDMIRKALINALDTEKDPGMQVELIQILVSIQEKRAVPAMEKLLHNEETPNYVKDQVTIGLPSLI
ncbi:HEAT repeat domain-containing protein [Aquimarina sp. 2201CG5-10]|uniref:HEAT repeat domain-containing protein n=1 Tax=Aquimarina callyspongiae TaxID=3098150 RepID=UPI002AB52071|nr:HEAT repeat domain-containing protein [Aquimarina sp. 2201CG5-10]MDY8135232.1 HEAT repeat domain-containing protein [Aquimarina sp. 2201CG5-10]